MYNKLTKFFLFSFGYLPLILNNNSYAGLINVNTDSSLSTIKAGAPATNGDNLICFSTGAGKLPTIRADRFLALGYISNNFNAVSEPSTILNIEQSLHLNFLTNTGEAGFYSKFLINIFPNKAFYFTNNEYAVYGLRDGDVVVNFAPNSTLSFLGDSTIVNNKVAFINPGNGNLLLNASNIELSHPDINKFKEIRISNNTGVTLKTPFDPTGATFNFISSSGRIISDIPNQVFGAKFINSKNNFFLARADTIFTTDLKFNQSIAYPGITFIVDTKGGNIISETEYVIDNQAHLIFTNSGPTSGLIDLQIPVYNIEPEGKVSVTTDIGDCANPGLSILSSTYPDDGFGIVGLGYNPLPELNITGAGSIIIAVGIYTDNLNISDETNKLSCLLIENRTNATNISFKGNVQSMTIQNSNLITDKLDFNNKLVNSFEIRNSDVTATDFINASNVSKFMTENLNFTGTFHDLPNLEHNNGYLNLNTPDTTHNIANITGGNGNISLANNSTINGNNIDSNGRGVLNLDLQGNAKITSDIGNNNNNIVIRDPFEISGKTGKNIEFLGSVNAKEITANNNNIIVHKNVITDNGINLTNNAKLIVKNPVTISGPITNENSTISIGENEVTINDKLQFLGNSKVDVAVTKDGSSSGKLVIAITGEIDASDPNTNLEILVSTPPTATAPALVPGKFYPIFDTTSGGKFTPPTNNIIITEQVSNNIQWIYDPTNNSIYLKRKNLTITLPQINDTIDNLIVTEQQTVFNELSYADNNALSNSLIASSTILNTINNNANSSLFSAIDNRIDCLASKPINPCPTGKSAGDNCNSEHTTYGGIWLSPFVGTATQKPLNKNFSTHNITSTGLTFGIDSFIDENNILGLALGYAEHKVKFKGIKSGDKGNITSRFLATYWHSKFSKHNFAQLYASITRNLINITDKRGTKSLGYTLAKGKAKSDIFNIEGDIGHHFITNDFGRFSPFLGLRYSHIKTNQFKDSGGANSLYNLIYKAQSHNQTDGVFGIKWGMPLSLGLCSLTPNLSATIYQTFGKSKIKPLIQVEGATLNYPTNYQPIPRTSYKLAANTYMNYDNIFDTNFQYGIILAKKYVGHQFSMKFRVLF